MKRDVDRLLAHFAELGRLGSLRDPIAHVAEAEVSLTSPQLHAVMWLHEDGPLTMATLAARIGCTGPTATGVIDRLEALGLVERGPKPGDRRVVMVALTDAGREMGGQLQDFMRQRVSFVLGLLDKHDRRQLLDLFGKLVDSLRASVDARSEEG